VAILKYLNICESINAVNSEFFGWLQFLWGTDRQSQVVEVNEKVILQIMRI